MKKTDMDLENAEKFIVSFKLQKYIKQLNNEKQKIIDNALKNNISTTDLLHEIDNKIQDANIKLETLIDMNNK